jgi:hypothetical protein
MLQLSIWSDMMASALPRNQYFRGVEKVLSRTTTLTVDDGVMMCRATLFTHAACGVFDAGLRRTNEEVTHNTPNVCSAKDECGSK